MKGLNKILERLSLLITCLVLISVFSGCSVIGLSMGAAADRDHPDRIDCPVNEIEQLKPGTKLELILQSNDILSGKYKETGQLPDQEYNSIFHEHLNESNELSAFPAPGDTITIVDLSGNLLEFVLEGYNMGYLSVYRIGEDKRIVILTRNISKLLLSDGETISVENLEKMISDGRLPVLQTLILDLKDETRAVPTDSIIQITRIDKNNRKWKGLAIGGLIDLAILSWLIYEHPIEWAP